MLVDRREERRLARQRRDALRGRFGQERFAALVKELVELHRLALDSGAIVSPFNLEGTLRHAIRGDLVLQGWAWRDADFAGKEILGAVYMRLRARRPGWNEGQPEWTISAGDLIERTRCQNCHAKLPEGHFKFCCQTCAQASHARLARRREMDEETTARTVASWI
jgi:hypothetical protein